MRPLYPLLHGDKVLPGEKSPQESDFLSLWQQGKPSASSWLGEGIESLALLGLSFSTCQMGRVRLIVL